MKSCKIRCLIILLIIAILLLTGCSPLDKDEVTVVNDSFHLITLEPNGIIYVKGIYMLAPYYSPNGKLCHYINGEIVEIDWGGNNMSMYGDDEHGRRMNDLYDEINNFLEDNPVSELLKIVTDVVEEQEYRRK